MEEEVHRLRQQVERLEEQLEAVKASKKKAREKITGMSAEVVDSNPYRHVVVWRVPYDDSMPSNVLAVCVCVCVCGGGGGVREYVFSYSVRFLVALPEILSLRIVSVPDPVHRNSAVISTSAFQIWGRFREKGPNACFSRFHFFIS